jgi:hypothetical protein
MGSYKGLLGKRANVNNYNVIKRKYKLIFFTDDTVNSRYHLRNIKASKKVKTPKEVVYIDPGVHELKKQIEYSRIKQIVRMIDNNELKDNEYISLDYPCDMNLKYQDLFVKKSVENNFKYADNPRYICAIQFKVQDYSDFDFRFEELRHIWERKNKVLAIGNLCRIINPNEFTDHVFRTINRNAHKMRQIHFYGLSLPCIKKYIPALLDKVQVSVDSTKWTRVHNKAMEKKYGKKMCSWSGTDRNDFFVDYMDEISEFMEVVY